METSSNVGYSGPLFRVQDFRLHHTTAWWFEHYTDRKDCTMRPFVNNKDSGWIYKFQLPEPLVKNNWFHFKYRLMGNKITQQANGFSIQNTVVSSTWMIRSGTIALGCHSSGSPTGCRSYYDNIKVRILVKTKPRVITGNICRLPLHKYPTLGGKMRPADSCKQIYDANLEQRKSFRSWKQVDSMEDAIGQKLWYLVESWRRSGKSGSSYCKPSNCYGIEWKKPGTRLAMQG